MRDFARPLFGFALQLTGDRARAEDLVQETFTEAWRCVESQREPDHARAWLFQIMRFRFAHLVKQRQRQGQPLPIQNAMDLESHSPDLARRLEDREAVQTALSHLSDDLRKTFLMVFEEQRTCRETAQTLGIPIGTVLSRLDRARKALRSDKALSARADLISGKSRANP